MKIITHPDNKDIIEGLATNEAKRDADFIHRPYGVQIVYSEYVRPDAHGGWKITDVLSCKFCTMVVDLDNPPKWAIYFGLVEEIRKPYFYEVGTTVFALPMQEVAFTYSTDHISKFGLVFSPPIIDRDVR